MQKIIILTVQNEHVLQKLIQISVYKYITKILLQIELNCFTAQNENISQTCLQFEVPIIKNK